MNGTVFKLLIKRFVAGLLASIWNSWLCCAVFITLLSLLFYFLSGYECLVRRALGLPTSRIHDITSAYYNAQLEQDCDAKIVTVP